MLNMTGGPHGSVSLRDEVEYVVGIAITTGELSAGTLISVPSLAIQFCVSATPVREALINLQKRGFLVPVPNKGFRVTEVSPTDIAEIAQLRAWLEVPALGKVAQKFPKGQLSRFRGLADHVLRAVDDGDLAGFVLAEAEFHDELLMLLGNRHLVETVQLLRQRARVVGLAEHMESPEVKLIANEHHRILDLMLDADSAGVEHLMQTHIERLAT